MAFYVYILRCQDGSYYTGYTHDVKARLDQHRQGRGARYTRMKKPHRIVYLEWFTTRAAAMKRERAIKHLTHQEKTVLIHEKQSRRHLDETPP